MSQSTGMVSLHCCYRRELGVVLEAVGEYDTAADCLLTAANLELSHPVISFSILLKSVWWSKICDGLSYTPLWLYLWHGHATHGTPIQIDTEMQCPYLCHVDCWNQMLYWCGMLLPVIREEPLCYFEGSIIVKRWSCYIRLKDNEMGSSRYKVLFK